MKFTRYNSKSAYYKRTFGKHIQKISIDAGFTCPNRDGTRATGGCTYCNNEAFTPAYCRPSKSITKQIDEGIIFFGKKYEQADYLAYFQAYSNTYASLDILKKKYEEALNHPKISGLVISTRPDCVDDEILDYLADLSKKYYLVLEFGIESTYDETLQRVNRAHTYKETVIAFEKAAKRNILTGGHLILGLPGETRKKILTHALRISQLPLKFLKLHQLQILEKTAMAGDFRKNPSDYHLFETADEYIDFVIDFLELLKPSIIIERFASESPENMLIAPKWGKIKNYELVHKLNKRLEERNTWQGKLFV